MKGMTIIMNWIKRAVAAAAAAAMTLSVTACGSNLSWAARISEDTTVPIGLYIYQQAVAYRSAVQNGQLNTGDKLADQTVKVSGSDVNALTYMDDQAQKSVKSCVGALLMADELKVTLTDEELEDAVQSATSAYQLDEEVFTENGVAQSSIEEYYKDITRKSKVFQAKYGADGTDPVDDDELKAFFKANYATIHFMQQYFYHDDGSVMSDDEKAAVKKEYESIKSRVEKGKLDFVKQCEEVNKNATDYKNAYTDSTSRFDTDDEDGQKILALKEGQLTLLVTDNAIALIQKAKLDKDGSKFKEGRETLLIECKYDAFVDELVKLAEKSDKVQFNDKAFAKFASKTRNFSKLNVSTGYSNYYDY